MLSKIEAKYIQSLYHKKQRDELSVFIVEGLKGVDELLNSSFVVQKIFAVNDWEHPLMGKAQLTRVSEEELQKISGLQTANKVLAIAEQQNFIAQKPQKGRITLALDGIQDPGNMGTIIRLCDWFGISKIVCTEETVDIYNPKVVQATMGSLARVEVLYTNLADYLKTTDLEIFGTFMEGKNIYKQELPARGIIVMGNEANGISTDIENLVTQKINIPRFGSLQQTESLNVATATAVILSEFKRNS